MDEFLDTVLNAQKKFLETHIEPNVITLNSKRFSILKKPGYITTLFGMKVEYANLPDDIDFFLQHREELLKVTNADKIRAMSDEELAEFMCANVSNGTVNCAFCAAEEFCRMGHNGWLEWLKQEVTSEKANG